MLGTGIDFSAPATLRKWPSLNKERVSVSLGARPYMISEGTLEECVQRFMEFHETQRHLYEIHTAPQSDLVGAILLFVVLETLWFSTPVAAGVLQFLQLSKYMWLLVMAGFGAV